MLNPLTDWEPGLQVRYHGSLTNLHGMYAAHLCTCRRCNHSHGSVRFRLIDANGATIVSCVRSASITPCNEDDAPPAGHRADTTPSRTPQAARLRCARGHFLPADFRLPVKDPEDWDDTCRCKASPASPPAA